MALVLKVDMRGDLRRCRIAFPENSDAASQWALLLQSVRQVFKLEGDAALTLKYRDEEGDHCTLTQYTLPDFLALSAGGPMRLMASVGATPAAAAAADAASAKPAEGEMDPARMLEAFDTIKGMIKMAKGKGKGCTGRKRQWMQEGCHDDWRECKRRWQQEQAMKHACPLCFTEMGAPWTCDGCSVSCADGSLPRYRCAVGCDFDLCGECFAKKEERDAVADAKKREEAAVGASEENTGDGFPEGDAGAEHQPDPCWEQWQAWREQWKAWKMMMRSMKGKCKGKGKWGKGKGKWGKGKCGLPESEEGQEEEEAWLEGPAAFWMQAMGQMCNEFQQAQQAQQAQWAEQAQWAQQAQQAPAPSAPPAGAEKDVEMTHDEPEGK